MFAMFLYLTLFIQNQLGYGPLEAGLRFLPTTLVSFAVAPITAKLAERRGSPRFFFGLGLTLVGVGLLLMRNVDAGVRLDRAAARLHPRGRRASAARTRSSPRSPSASSSRARRGWPAASAARSARWGSPRGSPGSARCSRRGSSPRRPAPFSGEVLSTVPLDKVPPQFQDAVHAGFVGALDDILLIAALIALSAAVAAVALVRT